MPLGPGTRLGPYEIVSAIGAGGMGEVYCATDTTLGRQVAIKILPDAFASDPERLARFEREAKTLASLNHPHIAAIYGFEKSVGTHALVMELVEGDDLSQRLAGGAIPLDEALTIATQIAEALEAAHERGIIHRDLKPANIKVRPDGTVKVLDFGLAKLTDPNGPNVSNVPNDPSPPNAWSLSPTIVAPAMTGVGMILGTAAYMAPEQARGKTIDKRADIWAFGAVLFEMLAGARAFPGDEVSDVLASVIAREPDLTAVPPRVRRLLTRCLEKDPRKRLRDIGDAMGLVDGAGVAAPNAETAATMLKRMRLLTAGGWTAAAAFAVSLVAALGWRPGSLIEADPPIARFRIERASEVYNRTASAFAVSPDGLKLAYHDAGSDGLPTLFVRTLATGEVREVRGSATAAPRPNSLFWSPDSRQLVRGTVTGGQVFDLTTGTSRPLCDCSYVGGSWNRDGTILVGGFDRRAGISRVSADDRTPVAVPTVDASADERDTWPVFLPDGRRFLFTRTTPGAGTATYVGSLDGGPPKRVVDGSRSIFIPTAGGRGSYLLGIESTGLVAQPFNLSTMTVTGPIATVAVGATSASASENGVLATNADGGRPKTVPTWFDRNGMLLGQVGEGGSSRALRSLAMDAS